MPRRINYAADPRQSGDILIQEKITRADITDTERAATAQYLHEVLTTQAADAPWEFTLRDITIAGQGHDEAALFYGSYH
ncbi:hypothetical protein [Gordonia sihwensis]|uniref:hypothetical protein n=1 Tax=Gordonia sihwensis TaxID=173559 RepID=UPI003D969CC0